MRVRLVKKTVDPLTGSFNPRTRESATYKQVRNRAVFLVSIHALVRVRHLTEEQAALLRCFNPRTRESATRADTMAGQ